VAFRPLSCRFLKQVACPSGRKEIAPRRNSPMRCGAPLTQPRPYPRQRGAANRHLFYPQLRCRDRKGMSKKQPRAAQREDYSAGPRLIMPATHRHCGIRGNIRAVARRQAGIKVAVFSCP
jgi:hypothetical protein